MFFIFLFGSFDSYANSWGIDLPWNEPEIAPPEIKPYELPTLKGGAPHYNTSTPALSPAPLIDPDVIFNTVLKCYPEKSKFKIDLNLVAGMKSNIDEYNSDDWPEISEHYIGIVGKMPLYSTTEQSRERQWEYQRRTATATAVASFTQALAERNYAYRLMGLYLSLEARSQLRVQQGVTTVSEQVALLEKVAATHRDVLAHEAKIVEHRLALVAMCESSYTDNMNTYLQKIAFLPRIQASEKK
ncbi:hypothetical protein MCT08_18525 [Vibrio aestuarianus]|uniref:hypothetical protein n=1 Tax=Vibrio aestuarianus TaxID=28171 RepID=UPI00237CC1E5|nr:hypothetical protein [Vibrio aestuarianus]MDE1251560.1 hypothetical protein [Vibrio aestuarianus]